MDFKSQVLYYYDRYIAPEIDKVPRLCVKLKPYNKKVYKSIILNGPQENSGVLLEPPYQLFNKIHYIVKQVPLLYKISNAISILDDILNITHFNVNKLNNKVYSAYNYEIYNTILKHLNDDKYLSNIIRIYIETLDNNFINPIYFIDKFQIFLEKLKSNKITYCVLLDDDNIFINNKYLLLDIKDKYFDIITSFYYIYNFSPIYIPEKNYNYVIGYKNKPIILNNEYELYNYDLTQNKLIYLFKANLSCIRNYKINYNDNSISNFLLKDDCIIYDLVNQKEYNLYKENIFKIKHIIKYIDIDNHSIFLFTGQEIKHRNYKLFHLDINNSTLSIDSLNNIENSKYADKFLNYMQDIFQTKNKKYGIYQTNYKTGYPYYSVINNFINNSYFSNFDIEFSL
jgi:hypothetical protein